MMTPEKNKFAGWRKLLPMALFLLIGLGLAGTGYAETLYVKKTGTKLQAEDSAKSDVLAKLEKGTPVTVVKKLKRFYQVSEPGGKTGWVFKFKLTSKAPEASGGGADELLGALGGKQKIAARESSSGSSIRGLTPVSENHAKKRGISAVDIQSVRQMETYRISEKEMDQFLKEGRLGEYGQ
jgi:uncharacterized protein YgiM (DUF1202 family)